MSALPKLILVHGWGLNSAIWQPLVQALSGYFECICLDLPGYGARTDQTCPADIQALGQDLLDQVPEAAYWCGWSLGGMALMAAAQQQPERFIGIQLLCTTPKFVHSQDWPMGMDMGIFEKFADELKVDYSARIQKFLLLQAGSGPQARALAKEAAELLHQYSPPSQQTLSQGLELLNNADLRHQLAKIKVPCQVISGRRDRVIHPSAGKELATLLPNGDFQLINSGHAPHLSHTQELSQLIVRGITASKYPGEHA